MSPERTFRAGETVLGLTVIALGAFVGYEAWATPSLVAAGVVGPALFPYLVATGLALVGARLLFEGLAAALEPVEALQLDWPAMAQVSAAFIMPVLLLEQIGWIPAGTVLFATASRAFGSRSLLRDVLIGVALTSLTFVVFDYGLNLDLPIGSLVEDAFDRTNA